MDSDDDISESENNEDIQNMIVASNGQAPIKLDSDETEYFILNGLKVMILQQSTQVNLLL